MREDNNDWYFISNISEVDSPALVVYEERVKENIRLLVGRVKSTDSLRPHVKTNKMAAVCRLMMDAGIKKFKCATIAEAEMLAMIKAPDVLLAYQPVGPKIQRLLNLVKTYPGTTFSCLADDETNTTTINEQCVAAGIFLSVFIDINTGMDRTGIRVDRAFELFSYCHRLSNLRVVGLHAYDGHINDKDILLRQQKSDAAFNPLLGVIEKIITTFQVQPVVVAGGSPAFATHVMRPGLEYSPGTFVFWDWGYKHLLPEEPYQYAALVITRIISIIDEKTFCTDLGHKAVAAENPLPRVHFLNAPGATPVAQSEEHLTVKVADSSLFKTGDVLYGVPVHICPTVALYDKAIVIKEKAATTEWQVTARSRKITI